MTTGVGGAGRVCPAAAFLLARAGCGGEACHPGAFHPFSSGVGQAPMHPEPWSPCAPVTGFSSATGHWSPGPKRHLGQACQWSRDPGAFVLPRLQLSDGLDSGPRPGSAEGGRGFRLPEFCLPGARPSKLSSLRYVPGTHNHRSRTTPRAELRASPPGTNPDCPACGPGWGWLACKPLVTAPDEYRKQPAGWEARG